MAYTLVRGRFHIHYPDDPLRGPQPDGDTIKFEPENPVLVEALRRRGSDADFNRRGYINIRFEAIDALESHFNGHHQPLELANAARDAMLRAAGYTGVEFHPGAPTVSNADPLSPLATFSRAPWTSTDESSALSLPVIPRNRTAPRCVCASSVSAGA